MPRIGYGIVRDRSGVVGWYHCDQDWYLDSGYGIVRKAARTSYICRLGSVSLLVVIGDWFWDWDEDFSNGDGRSRKNLFVGPARRLCRSVLVFGFGIGIRIADSLLGDVFGYVGWAQCLCRLGLASVFGIGIRISESSHGDDLILIVSSGTLCYWARLGTICYVCILGVTVA